MAKIIDISVPLKHGIPVWPGEAQPEIGYVKRIKDGCPSNLSNMRMIVHTGTHIDAPKHVIDSGATVDSIPLDTLVGRAHVAYFPENEVIYRADLDAVKIPNGTKRLLLRTRNSRLWEEGVREFREDYTALSDDAAGWVVEHGIRLIGIDYLSIHHLSKGEGVHGVLLGAGVVVLETLDLSKVEPGEYDLVCLPLRLIGVEAAPARAILRKD